MILERFLEGAADTEGRYNERTKKREKCRKHWLAGDLQKANEQKRYELRQERIESYIQQSVPHESLGTSVAELAQERILGHKDLLGIAYLQRGLLVAKAVGCIMVPSGGGRREELGTGFLISPELLMTNNHVIERPSKAWVRFNYQNLHNGTPVRPIDFELDPDAFFVTSKQLDCTIVAVRPHSDGGASLSSFGWIPLVGRQGKILVGESASIVGHPNGEPKQVSIRDNRVVDIFDDFIHYETDTEPGSSGSPVFSDFWELVALHHSGVPATNDDGDYLALDGSIWNRQMGADKLKWIANEGIRVSRIVKWLETLKYRGEEERMVHEALRNRESPRVKYGTPEVDIHPVSFTTDVATKPRNGNGSPGHRSSDAHVAHDGEVSVTIPLHISVKLGDLGAAANAESDSMLTEARRRRHTSLRGRRGYDPSFLAKRVELPKISDFLSEDIAELKHDQEEHELKYTHFSVVMNKRRRFAFFTAVNIDGRRARNIKREGHPKWTLDPRMKEHYQVGNDLYRGREEEFDRGHLVRRLDPVWGSEREALIANDDTFYFTNSAPQHGRKFNQTVWLDLEEHLLDTATDQDMKMSVFTGPVFDENDPYYSNRGAHETEIQIPMQYWKVVVTNDRRNRLWATALLLSQGKAARDFIRRREERLDLEDQSVHQVSIRKIERLTGLNFDHLKMVDALRRRGREESLLENKGDMREIHSLQDLVL